MACFDPIPYYLPHTTGGIETAINRGEGHVVAVSWTKAYASSQEYSIAYALFYSTEIGDAFSEGVKFLSIDPAVLVTEITELTPGDTYYFGVRAVQYLSEWYNPQLLPDSGSSKYLPEGFLLTELDEQSAEIPITNIDLFPSYGVVQIGSELIRYLNVDLQTGSLINLTRGFLNTDIRIHQLDGYDGYLNYDNPAVRFWPGYSEKNNKTLQETSAFHYPNFAYVNSDGYRREKDLINTDLTLSDQSQADFPSYDYVGWHRTDPSALLRGECLDTYIGGEYYCADGYNSVGTVIRGIPVTDVNHQRQEMLLDALGTGEEVTLLKKVWTNVICSCMQNLDEHPDERCHLCFEPSTLVRSELGWKPIKDIQVGEKVLSGDGQYHTVTQIFVNHYDGELRSITSTVNASPILTTPEHPFLTLRGEHRNRTSYSCGPGQAHCNDYIQNGDGIYGIRGNNKFAKPQRIKNSNRWQASVQIEGKVNYIGSFDSKLEAEKVIEEFTRTNRKLGHVLEWDDAKNISENDWLVSKWNNEETDLELIKIPDKYTNRFTTDKRKLKAKGAEQFLVNEDFLWIIGMYIAEGSSDGCSLSFDLHKKEIDFATKISSFFESYGYHAKIVNKSENGMCVRVCGIKISKWLPEWIGKKCYTKKIPEELMKLPKFKTWALIRGIYDGDGSKNQKEIRQTSEVLALQLSELLHRVGEQPILNKTQSKTLTPKGNTRKPCYSVSWAEETDTKNNRVGRWNCKGELLTKVRKTETVTYSGSVYNLEVEGDHTYVVQGVVVHNCQGTGRQMGYEQFFNPRRSDGRILVRFGPTIDDVKNQEAGMTNVFIPDCWTLVTPAIKNYDVIIRYLEDKTTEEFRYEIINVTRNKLFFSLSGAQKFTAHRIPRTDPTYQLPYISSTATIPQVITTGVGFILGANGIPLAHQHEIRVSENITNVNQINQITSIALQGIADHSHLVINGVVQPSSIDQHVHSLIFP